MNVTTFPYNKNQTLIYKDDLEKTAIAKADTDLSNCTRPYIIESVTNGTSWCRTWSDGFIEQGGRSVQTGNDWVKVKLIKEYTNTNYNIYITSICPSVGAGQPSEQVNGTKIQTTVFEWFIPNGVGWGIFWRTCGY